MKRIPVILFFLLHLICSAQEFQNHNQLWSGFSFERPVNSNFKIQLDGSYRTTDFIANQRQQLIRITAKYNLPSKKANMTVGGGYAFSRQLSYDALIPTPEHRITGQFVHEPSRWTSQRLRYELRIFDLVNNSQGFSVYNRFRYQFKKTIFIGQRMQLVFFDEIMTQSEKLECFYFDQNRIYTGIKWKSAKNFGFDLGLMGILINKKNNKYEWDNVIWLNFIF